MNSKRMQLAFALPALWPLMLSSAAYCQSNAAAGTSRSVSSSVIAQAVPKASPAYRSDPRFLAAIAEGKKLKAEEQFTFAYDAYKKANKIAEDKCSDCIAQMFELDMKMGNKKDAVRLAAQLAELAATPAERSAAETLQGQAILSEGGEKPKQEQLKAADTALKAAIADEPQSATPHYVDGIVLTRMGDIEGARKQFEQCLACESPEDPSYLRTRHFAEDPAISIAKHAPAFTVTALDGSKFNLDAMGGRVVLIDFWATWCGPCNEELPQIKKIAKDFAGQPLVIISVSWDDDAGKWKQFIEKNQMSWVQYRDADHRLGTLFEINAIPHYFTIDSDGVLTSELLGTGYDVEGRLKKLVAKAKLAGAAPNAAAAATAPGATVN